MIKYEMFLNEEKIPGMFQQNPITAKERPDAPIVVSTRWNKTSEGLVKTFRFRLVEQRDQFVNCLLEYEAKVQHNATIIIRNDRVGIMVITQDIGSVTELDKEYASFCDILYKDITNSPIHS